MKGARERRDWAGGKEGKKEKRDAGKMRWIGPLSCPLPDAVPDC